MRADQTESPVLAAGTHSTQDHLGPTRCSWRRVSSLNSNSAWRDPHETFLRNTLLQAQEWSSHLQSQHWKRLLKILWPEFLNHPNRPRIQSHCYPGLHWKLFLFLQKCLLPVSLFTSRKELTQSGHFCLSPRNCIVKVMPPRCSRR